MNIISQIQFIDPQTQSRGTRRRLNANTESFSTLDTNLTTFYICYVTILHQHRNITTISRTPWIHNGIVEFNVPVRVMSL